MMETPLGERLQIRLPIVQAPIGNATSPALAAAVSNAGGLGTLALSWRTLDECRELIRATRRLTSRPFAVNLVLEWPQPDRLRVVLEEGVRLVSFFWGDPAPYLNACREAGATVIHTVGSVEEARAAAAAGVDVIVAQGLEAGGHVRGTLGTMALVPAVVEALPKVPVLAAGGIVDARGVRAAMALGAAGVWVGTRFVASDEASSQPAYRQFLIEAGADDTVHTTLFDGGWPSAPHRVLRNSTYRSWEAAGKPAAPARPGEGDVIGTSATGRPVLRYSFSSPTTQVAGEFEAMALYAGQGVGLIRSVEPAARIVANLADGLPGLS